MSERNGPDIGAVYQLLTEVAQRVAEHGRRFDQLTHRVDQLAAEIARLRTEFAADIAGLRQTIADYHHSVVGHGMLLSGLEGRMLRVEQHLRFEPIGQ